VRHRVENIKMVKLHKDYSPDEFTYDKIEKAWMVTNGTNGIGRYFFVAHLVNQPFGGGGNWMAFLRRPDKKDWRYVDVPFEPNTGFAEPGDADNAIRHRVYQELGWRIEEADVSALPEEIDENTKGLLGFVK